MTDAKENPGLAAAVEAIEAELQCESCGTEQHQGDPILCRICGEPVLGDGWTP